jgi:hypothetical protein
MRFLTALVATLAMCMPLFGQDADLRFKAPAGTEVRYHWSSMGTEKVTPAGQTEAARASAASIDIGLLVRVKERTDTGLTAEIVIERMKTTAQSAKGPMEFDSTWTQEKKDKAPLAKVFQPLVGTVLTLKLDGAGTIMEVTGGEALLDTKNSTDPIVRSTAAVAKTLFDPTVVKARFWPIFSTQNPGEKVAMGATWQSTQVAPIVPGIEVEVVRDHTLDGVDAGVAQLSYIGTPKLVGTPPADLGTRELLGSSIMGAARWDTNTGMLIEQTSSTGMTLDLNSPKVHVVMDSTQEVTLRRVEEKSEK